MSKLFVAIAQLLISLKLIKGYKLLKDAVLNDMAKPQVDLESYCAELKAILQEKTDEAAVHEQRAKNAVTQRDAAEKRCTEMDRIERELKKQLEAKESEVELAASEVLVLKEEQAEATALSKQLKEALDRWTS